jgi:hypothetical protein
MGQPNSISKTTEKRAFHVNEFAATDSFPIKNASIAFISGLLNWAKNLLIL